MTTTTLTADDSQPLDPQQAEACWAMVDRCPACGSRHGDSLGTLPDLCYAFGTERVPFPDAGIAVMGCNDCGLVYKGTVPSPAFLTMVFKRQAADKWMAPHDFSVEVAVLQKLTGKRRFDLLDVGAAGGALLEACTGTGMTDRRSALDVIRYPGIEAHLAGEFIEGFLDDPSLIWGREAYDVVTVFDVIEHLYYPPNAFDNLRSLVKPGGLVVMESGNIENFWPRRYGVNQWWYVRLLEHHIFWSRRSLEKGAAAHGFEVVSWEETRHKSRRDLCRTAWAADLLKVGLYCIARNYYSATAQIFGKQGNQPWFPLARDHFRACLRKR